MSSRKDIAKYPFGHYSLPKLHKRLLGWAHAMPKNWFGRRGALILRKIILKSLRSALVDATVDGVRMRFHTNDNVSERKFLFMPQFFDAAERRLIKTFLPSKGVFVDIGANAGIYSLSAAAVLEEGGRVLSFEPNPVVCDRLQFNLALNGFEKRVDLRQIGVSDKSGSFSLLTDPTNLGGSSLVTQRGEEKHQIEIPCEPLLDILKSAEIEKIDMLKIDIEGAEDKALIPFFDQAPTSLFPDYIIIEDSRDQWETDLFPVFEKSGYMLKKNTRMNMIWAKKDLPIA